MPRKTIVLHMGGAKVGSTALQASLGQWHGAMTQIGRTLTYWVAEPLGDDSVAFREFSRSDAGNASWSWGECVNSLGVELAQLREPCLHARLSPVWDAMPDGSISVLSNEAWGYQLADASGRQCECDPTLMDVQILIFIRNQIDWIKSAYLQWGLWSGADVGDFIVNIAAAADWRAQERGAWSLGPRAVHLVETSDVCGWFADFVGLPRPELSDAAGRPNMSLGLNALRFLRSSRSLGQSEKEPLAGLVVEWLVKKFELPDVPVGSFLRPDEVALIAERFEGGNAELRASGVVPASALRLRYSPTMYDAEARDRLLNPGDSGGAAYSGFVGGLAEAAVRELSTRSRALH